MTFLITESDEKKNKITELQEIRKPLLNIREATKRNKSSTSKEHKKEEKTPSEHPTKQEKIKHSVPKPKRKEYKMEARIQKDGIKIQLGTTTE